jgi:hypothetical protein
MADERIMIEFERSGGFGGLITRRTVDTANLPPGEADELVALLDQANLDDVHPVSLPMPVPDAFHYRLSVVRGARRWDLTLGDAEVPVNLRPLLRYLAKDRWQS